MLLSASGCSFIASAEPTLAPILYHPDTAGIVAGHDTDGPGSRYELTDGRAITIPEGVRIVSSSDPDVGDLLLSGTQPVPWLTGARALDPKPVPEPADCYPFIGDTRADGTHVYKTVTDPAEEELVIVFRKAAGWQDLGYFPDSDVLFGVFTCVNHRGEATEHRMGQ
jgi:hypothetical protein